MKSIVKASIFGGLCLILTVVITIQFRATQTSESASSQNRRADKLKDQIIALSDQNTKYEKSLESSDKSLQNARSAVSEDDTPNMEKSELIKKYNIYSGNTDVHGQGVVLTYIPKKNQSVPDVAKDIRYLINEFKNAGAEAISINNERIVDTSAIESVKNKIEVNGKNINEPFVINVIGDSNMLNSGVARPGGIVDVLRYSGVTIKIDQKQDVIINKFIGGNV